MRKQIIILLLFFFVSGVSHSQKEDNVWIIGRHSTINNLPYSAGINILISK